VCPKQTLRDRIGIFKGTIRKKNVLSDATLEPLRATVVSLLVQANQAILFIGSASAAVRASMSGDTKPDSPGR
jgi:hypothetical protein